MTQAITTTTETQAIQRTSAFDEVARHAAALSKADIIPDAYRNKPGNCLIALEMAERMGCAPLQIMQAMFVVHGQPGWSAKWLIATANASGRFSPLRWRFTRDDKGAAIGAVCYAKEKSSGELLESIEVTLEMAKAEGWLKNPKWTSMRELMFVYRSAAFWVRMYCPEIAMGLQSAEELEDIRVTQQQPSRGAFTAALGAMSEAPALPVPGVTDAASEPVDAPVHSFDPETGEVE